ncbi:hypothetical protein GLOTRDRAFT_26487, partial [Gloeophyllum trabeum ATCC 11539]
TQTIGARTIFHKAQATMKSVYPYIQTQEQLDTLLGGIKELQYVETETMIRDPPAINRKGRHQTAQLTSHIEGPLRGGGPTKMGRTKRRRCGLCKQTGHNHQMCP